MRALSLEKAVLGLALVGLAAAPLLVAPFTVTLLNYIGIGALVALGLVLLTGVGGLTSFGQASLVGIGAYSTAWLTTRMGASPWLGLLLALALTGAVAAVLGAVTLRLGGHFLPLSTIAWGIAIYFLFGNIPGARLARRHHGHPAAVARRAFARLQLRHLLPDLGPARRGHVADRQPARTRAKAARSAACAAAPP